MACWSQYIIGLYCLVVDRVLELSGANTNTRQNPVSDELVVRIRYGDSGQGRVGDKETQALTLAAGVLASLEDVNPFHECLYLDGFAYSGFPGTSDSYMKVPDLIKNG